MSTTDFDRSKIYEKLDYRPEPSGYSGKINWTIQQQIAATNGIHYVNEVEYLNEYPIPDMPISTANESGQLLLDIGCGWGRWLIAAANKKYVPIGADLRLEFCETARVALHENGVKGYTVVADLKNLPFKDNVFNKVWSFSVIQHTHRERLISCINHIYRILQPGGQTKLEFPNKDGVRNRFGPVKKFASSADDYDSWCVRYYTVEEYKDIFDKIFNNFYFENHSFLGIGVLPNDLNYIKDFKIRLGVYASLSLSKLTTIIPFLKNYSDSIYVQCEKERNLNINHVVAAFNKSHKENPNNNLNITPLLCCPKSGADLHLSEDRNFLISSEAGMKFPIINEIPILIESEGLSL